MQKFIHVYSYVPGKLFDINDPYWSEPGRQQDRFYIHMVAVKFMLLRIMLILEPCTFHNGSIWIWSLITIMLLVEPGDPHSIQFVRQGNTRLKSDVTRRDHVVRCHGSHECWFTHRQFYSQFYSRRHSLRITLKYTTLVHMRSSNAWTMKSWQRSEWRLGFNSVLCYHFDIQYELCDQLGYNSESKSF